MAGMRSPFRRPQSATQRYRRHLKSAGCLTRTRTRASHITTRSDSHPHSNTMQELRSWLIDLLFLSFLTIVSASDITSFTDAKCTRSWRSMDTVNGYPDGMCKPLNVTTGQSFQIQRLDPGCAGKDTTSSKRQKIDLIDSSYIIWRESWAAVLL